MTKLEKRRLKLNKELRVWPEGSSPEPANKRKEDRDSEPEDREDFRQTLVPTPTSPAQKNETEVDDQKKLTGTLVNHKP